MSVVPAYTAVPPGQSPPYATVRDDDHSAWIIVVTALGIVITLLALVTRVLIQRCVNFGWGPDDSLITVSTMKVVLFIQSSLVLVACSDGLGKSIQLIPLHQQIRVQKLYYASNIFYLCALDLSKVSTLMFARRLMAPNTMVLRYTNVLLVLISASTVTFILLTSLQCDLAEPWMIVHHTCSGWFLRWEIQGAIACLWETTIFVAPVWLVCRLKTESKTKVEVIIPFAIRLVTIILTGLRLVSFNAGALTNNPFLHEASYICWTQAELSWSLIAATIPITRRFAFSLVTYYNSGQFATTLSGSGNRNAQDNTFRMKSMKSVRRQKFEPAYPGTVATEHALHDRGNNSQEMIIKKDVTFDVQSEHESGQ